MYLFFKYYICLHVHLAYRNIVFYDGWTHAIIFIFLYKFDKMHANNILGINMFFKTAFQWLFTGIRWVREPRFVGL